MRLRGILTRRRLLAVVLTTLALAVTILASAMAYEGSSLYDNIGPAAPAHSDPEKYPSSNYGLDYHVGDIIDTPHTSAFDKKSPFDILPNPGAAVTGAIVNSAPTGIHPENAPDLMAQKFAAWGWDVERFVSGLVITLFGFSQTLDIIDGGMPSIARTVNNLYGVLGGQWLGLALACLGGWIALQMAGRNFTHTVGGVLKSLACAMVAMVIIAQPVWAIGGTFHLFHEAGTAVMAEITGTDNPTAALKSALIEGPFLALEFGGTEHCVDAAGKPTPPHSRSCKTRIDNRKKYMNRWLAAGPANGAERTLWHKALLNGKVPSSKEINDAGMPANSFDGVKLGPADKSAVDIQQAQGGWERLGGVVILGFGLLGSWLLIGVLSLLLIVLPFAVLAHFLASPFAVIAALIPGPGVAAFMMWGRSLLGTMARSLWYLLILAIDCAVLLSLMSTMPDLGFLLAFVALAGVQWLFLFKWRHIYMGLVGAVSRHGGHAGGFGGGGGQGGSARQKITQAYVQQRMVRSMANPVGEAAKRVAFGAKEGSSKPPRKGGVIGHLGLGARTGAELVDERNNAQRVAMQGRNAAAQSPRARAVTELARERKRATGKAAKDLSDEKARRDRASDLRLRQKAARLDGGDLSPNEQKDLRDLESKRMPKRDYDALAASVTDEAARAKQPDHGFSEEEIAKRARVIVARDAAAEHEEAVNRNGNSGDGDGRRRLQNLRERARRSREAPHEPSDGAKPEESSAQAPPARTWGRRDWSAREWKGDDWKNGGDQPPQDPPRRIRLRRPPSKPPEDKP